MAWETTEGQALELGWRKDNRIDLDDEHYLTMVLKKTCWLTTIHPLRLGCLIGARGTQALDPLIRLGFFFGAAFQIQDDLLNLEGGPGYGKELNGDLLEGKRTLMLIHALPSCQRPRAGTLAAFSRRRACKARAGRCGVGARTDRAQRCHGTRKAGGTRPCRRGAVRVRSGFAGLPDSRDRQFLRSLVTWVLRRLH